MTMTEEKTAVTEHPSWCDKTRCIGDGFHQGFAGGGMPPRVSPYRTPIDDGADYVDQIHISNETGQIWIDVVDAERLIAGVAAAIKHIETEA